MDQTSRIAGVVGWPIGHSLSPRVHDHWLRRYRIDGHYVPLGLRPQDFEAAFGALPKLGFRGVNVTIPHKEAALARATTISDRAALIGAANTITFRPDGGIHADNTDGDGFIRNLRQAAPAWRAARGPALVLGAGGSARAIVAALLSEGAPEVRIANRTRSRADLLRGHFGGKVAVLDWDGASEAADGAMTIVNATALGMAGQPDLAVRLDAAPRETLVADLVYRPLLTPFLALARRLGLSTADGLGMLLHQAAPGFERWFGRRPEVDDELRAAVLAE